MTQLSAHFSLAEFTASDTSARRGIDNSLPTSLIPAAQATADMTERIRAYLSSKAGRDVPISITSGYRSMAVNSAIGGMSGLEIATWLCAIFWVVLVVVVVNWMKDCYGKVRLLV